MQESTGWRDLAGLLSSLNDEVTEPLLERAAGLPSVFQMADEDLDIRLNELGQFFRFGVFNDEDKAMVVQQRLDELHFKDTLYPLKKTLARELYGTEVAWSPLYNQKGVQYGDDFRTASNIPDLQDWWMTSRGVLRVNIDSLSALAEKGIDPLDTIEATIATIAEPLIPLDIVYDGIVFYFRLRVQEDFERASMRGPGLGITEYIDLPEKSIYTATLNDEAPMDEFPLDGYSWSIVPIKEIAKAVGELERVSVPDSRPLVHAKLDEFAIDGVVFDVDIRKAVKEAGGVVSVMESSHMTGTESQEIATTTQMALFSLPEVRIYTPALVDELPLDRFTLDSDSWTRAPSWEGANIINLSEILTLPESTPLADAQLDECAIDSVTFDLGIFKPVTEFSFVSGIQDAVNSTGTEQQEGGWASPGEGDFNLPESRILTPAVIDELPLDRLTLDSDSWTRAPSWEGGSVTLVETISLPESTPLADAQLDEYAIDSVTFDLGIFKPVVESAFIASIQDAITAIGAEQQEGGWATPESGDFGLPESRILTPAIVDELPIDRLTLDADSWTIAPSWEGASVTLTETLSLPESTPLVDASVDEYAIDTITLDIGLFKPVLESAIITNLTEDD